MILRYDQGMNTHPETPAPTALAVDACPETPDPHHDSRPWQDCIRKGIRKDDLVESQLGGTLVIGVAHHQDADGNWFAEFGYRLTWGDHWPLRRIPAPTPPAVVSRESVAASMMRQWAKNLRSDRNPFEEDDA